MEHEVGALTGEIQTEKAIVHDLGLYRIYQYVLALQRLMQASVLPAHIEIIVYSSLSNSKVIEWCTNQSGDLVIKTTIYKRSFYDSILEPHENQLQWEQNQVQVLHKGCQFEKKLWLIYQQIDL